MPLLDIKSKVKPAQKPASKSDIPIVAVDGLSIKRFVDAKKSLAEAEATVAELEPQIKGRGVREICGLNIENPGAPRASVKLQDETGAITTITMQNRYSLIGDVEAADAIFTNMESDINNFVQMTVRAKFNDAIFISQTGANSGEFSDKIFKAYQTAIDKVTAELKKSGLLPDEVESPLSSSKVAVVRKTFHAERWSVFKDVEQQLKIQAVVPATVSAKT